MKVSKNITITDCSQCPHSTVQGASHSLKAGLAYYCSKLGEIVNCSKEVPTCCPLPDFSQAEFNIYLCLKERYSSVEENVRNGKYAFDDYQDEAMTTALPQIKGDINYGILKLNGESGELAEKWAKIKRDHNHELTLDLKQAMLLELGDVLWYVAFLSEAFETKLSLIAEMNLKKLQDRKDRGTIHGDGDNR